MRSHLALLLPLSLIAGCTRAADAPSMEVRAVELRPDTVAATPRAVAPASPALAAKIASLVARARTGDRDFALPAARLDALRRALAAPEGSETWIDAQARRSALEVARDASTDALTELDALLLATETRVAEGSNEGGVVEVRAALAEVSAIVARQAQVLESLSR